MMGLGKVILSEILLFSALTLLAFFIYSSPPSLGRIAVAGLVAVAVALGVADFITALRKGR